MRFLDANIFIYAYYRPKKQLTEKEEAMKDLSKYNPQTSFPTILVDGGASVIMGFDEATLNGLG